ncbi:hypothetical protein [Nocardiopsis alba]|uniref:hypothetical protein n=1 Tax=Nocardiopsis alba TaxID=53437 RepID=UPI0035DDBAD8
MRTTVNISGAAPARRFLTPTGATDDNGRAVLTLAGPGDIPVGTSGAPGLDDGDVTPFEVGGRPVWTVEAGGALDPGAFVGAGTDGRAVAVADGDPYAVAMCLDSGTGPDEDGTPGSLVRVALLRTVALTTGTGGGGSVSAEDITDSTEVGRNVLTAENGAAARSAIGAGTSSQNLTAMTAAEVETGTSTTARAINAEVLAAEIDRRIAEALAAGGS